MVYSATAVFLILTLLATQWPRTIQTFPDSLQVLNAVSAEDLDDHSGQGVVGGIYDLEGNPEGEPDVVLNDLWSDISSAFQFLEDRPMDDKLKAKLLAHEIELIRMREKAKRLQLPINQHNFVRFGKRSSSDSFSPRENQNVPPSKRQFHSFVRFGKRQASLGTEEGPLDIPGSDQWQYDVEGRRHFIRPNQLNQGLEGDGNTARQHSFPHLEHSNNINLEQIQRNFFDTLVHRFRRSSSSHDETAFSSSEKSNTPDSLGSVDDTGRSKEKLEPTDQADSDNASGGDAISALRSWQRYAKRRLAYARIGRLPASVFYPKWMKMNPEDQPTMKSSQESFLTQSPNFDLNVLPRYG